MSAAAGRRLIDSARVFVVLCCLFVPATPAVAQGSAVSFVAGAALAFGMHEAAHVALDVTFGVPPGVRKVSFGPIPFFALTHDPVSPAREFAISSAGFWTQHVSSEIVLTRRPHLRHERGPLLKGIVAFNVLASAAYAGAAFAGAGPAERDTRGMAMSADVSERWVGGLILAPAVFDAVRYYNGDAAWARWASRASKAAGALLVIKAAR